jgi:hypothetical protein
VLPWTAGGHSLARRPASQTAREPILRHLEALGASRAVLSATAPATGVSESINGSWARGCGRVGLVGFNIVKLARGPSV